MTRRGALALAPLLAGCGFRLRTWSLAAALGTVRIDADASVDLHRELGRALRRAGVDVVSGGADADLMVSLAEQHSEQRDVTVNSAGRAGEAELTLSVEFAVRGAGGAELVAKRRLRGERLARIDGDNLLGSSEQQEVVAAEIRADLVGRMMRTLGALARTSAANTDEVAHADSR